jgi:glycosyltransferase involved in cell wall biosynthesis
VLPGAGGIQSEVFFPPAAGLRELVPFSIVNPRGVRAYIRNDTFFKAIPGIRKNFSQARFLCPSMAEEPQAIQQVRALGLEGQVELLPRLPRPQMAELFRQAHVVVSPSTHDGTPNSLLEAMACGCFPVVSDLESLREWITPGQNGLLFDPGDPFALSEAVQLALNSPLLRDQAQAVNVRLIAERAAYTAVMPAAAAFYASLIA